MGDLGGQVHVGRQNLVLKLQTRKMTDLKAILDEMEGGDENQMGLCISARLRKKRTQIYL